MYTSNLGLKLGSLILALSLIMIIMIFIIQPSIWTQAQQSSLLPIQCPRTGGSLVVIHWGDPKSFNPDSQVDDALFAIASQIYNKLINLDVNYNIIPELASSWEVSPNGSTFTFHLVRNVKWHD
jgi:ABC-type transport system substrate-binding protein